MQIGSRKDSQKAADLAQKHENMVHERAQLEVQLAKLKCGFSLGFWFAASESGLCFLSQSEAGSRRTQDWRYRERQHDPRREVNGLQRGVQAFSGPN